MDPSRSAEWSELPGELLQLISCRLESPLYRLRLRSCVFRGTLHAVDNTGRTVTVALPDASLALAAAPVFGGDKKFLVESDGALLLVDLFLSNDREFEDFDDFDAFEWERTVRFDVFSLDREGKRWVEVRSLGDRVLFLGDDCAFSASAKDLGVRRGNCVVFRDDGLGGTRVQNGMGVFYLDDGKISPLPECPDFAQLFRPPDWPSLQLH
ncbi:F-box protein SKIP23 [Cajanus cajan]|uniref:F-box protein SKIP23 n=1 Tax=Cajanus cajan TaxID=3821 RepID=UPI00098D8428|nr:F-box protein SKIP23 [Cajanus cajan]